MATPAPPYPPKAVGSGLVIVEVEDPSLDAADRLAATSQTCTACGRTYARRHLVILHEQPEAHG